MSGRPGLAVPAAADRRGSADGAQRVAANAASLLGAYVLPRLCTLAAAVLAARVLGTAEFGRYGAAAAFAVMMSIVATLGMMPLLIRDIAREPAAAAGLLGAAHRIKTAANLVMLATLVAVAYGLLRFPPPVVLAAALLGVGYAIGAYAENYGAYFQALERMHVWMQANAIYGLVTGVLGIALVLATHSVVWFCAAPAAGQAAALAWLVRRAPPALRRPARPAPGTVRRLVRALAPFAAAFLLLTVYYKLDILLLTRWRTAREAGIYAAAYKFVDIAQALAVVAAGAVYPRLSRAAERIGAGRRWAGTRATELVVLAAVPAGALLLLLREPVIRTVYGAGYVDAAAVLGPLAAAIPPLTVNIMAGYVLGAAGRIAHVAAAYGAAAALNVVLNLLLIPAYGAWGAAAAMLGSEAALAVVLLLVLRRQAAAAPRARVLATAAAAAVACVVLEAVPGQGWAAAALFLALAALLYHGADAVPPEARAALKHVLPGRRATAERHG